MEKKKLIKLAVLCVAVVSAFVILGISSGFFGLVFRGYNTFFNYNNYISRQMFVSAETEVAVSDKSFKLETVSPFSKGEDKEIYANVKVSAKQEKGCYIVTLTFINKYGLNGGAIFSGVFLEKTGSKKTAPFNGLNKTTSVSLICGDNVVETELSSYQFSRGKSVYVFCAEGDFQPEKLLIKGFVVTEYKKR